MLVAMVLLFAPPLPPRSTVFREDVLVCPCGGRRVVVAFITEKKVVTEILEHLGLPTTGPPIAGGAHCRIGPGRALAGDVPSVQRSLQ